MNNACPSCGAVYAVTAKDIGRKIKCKKCSSALRVDDTGEGIPKDQLHRLFTKYGRVEGQKLSSRTDTGLGLVFCRMAVELHGGHLGVESEVGRGTRFTVELPARPAGRDATQGRPDVLEPPPGKD